MSASVRRITENEYWLWLHDLQQRPLGCRGQRGLCTNKMEFVVSHKRRRDYWCGSCLPGKYLVPEAK